MSERNVQKTNFFFGLMSGIAIMAVIGFFVMFGVYLNQNNSANSSSAVAGSLAETGNQANPTPSKTNLKVTESDHVRGNFDAPVTIVEFSDFQCPYCARFHTTLQQVMDNYPNDVRWVYKHFPLDSIHPLARKATEASECADEQGKFWQYTDEIFNNQSGLSINVLNNIAQDLGLDTAQFDECLNSGKYVEKVEADYQQGIQMGVRGTPGNFINGQSVPGAVPLEQLEMIIDSLL